MQNALEGLNSSAIHALRRLGMSGKIDRIRGIWSSSMVSEGWENLEKRGLVTRSRTPKGRKEILTITEEGKKLLPIIADLDRAAKADAEEKLKQENASAGIREAAPDLLEALQGMLEGCERNPENTKWWVRQMPSAEVCDKAAAAIAKALTEV